MYRRDHYFQHHYHFCLFCVLRVYMIPFCLNGDGMILRVSTNKADSRAEAHNTYSHLIASGQLYLPDKTVSYCHSKNNFTTVNLHLRQPWSIVQGFLFRITAISLSLEGHKYGSFSLCPPFSQNPSFIS